MSGGVWIASYVLLWVLVGLLSVTCIVLLRQIGVLHARVRPLGVHFAGEGLEQGTPAPRTAQLTFDADLTLVTFTSPTCTICASLVPSLEALDREYRDVAVRFVEHADDTREVFRAYNVSSTPYVIAVDADGLVVGGGVANALEQVEELIETARAGVDPGVRSASAANAGPGAIKSDAEGR
jgi:thiol-disulfide isomerase/thioredoxin